VYNLNIQQSESLVRLVARLSGTEETVLGEKGKVGILQNMNSRQAFLAQKEHKVVFHYTPKPVSWLNQTFIWFSILARKLLKRASFKSVLGRIIRATGAVHRLLQSPDG
jgi:hypothetical protein